MTQVADHLGGHLNKTHTDGGAMSYIMRTFKPESFLDVGCGPGGVVAMAKDRGLKVKGIDGDWSLKAEWAAHNLQNDIIVHDFETGPPDNMEGLYFDVCWSVEFLEHVYEKYMPNYMSCFQRAKYVVCTAAPPGLPGHHHVNCQLTPYWIEKFAEYGFKYDANLTREIIAASTMRKRFLERHGMVFINESRIS